MYGVEKLGLLKFDVLGLRTVDVIENASRYAGINQDKIPLDDFYTYSQLRLGETFGIFQYEGWGYTKFIKKMQPRTFDHLIALGALYRPGPLDSGMADEFIRAMNDESQRPLSSLDGITDDTYGILLYQEQVMQATVKYAGFTLNEADTLRKAMGKKDAELMASVLSNLRTKLMERGLGHDFTSDLITKIDKFARYGWNKAHSVAYALLSYKTAYLKFTHPTEFFCALLNSELQDGDRVREIMAEAVAYSVKIIPPNINISEVNFKLHSNSIYGGLLSIKGIGTKACEAIISERNTNGKFKNTEDLRNRIPPKKLNITMMKTLSESGVFNVT
jgi:DNA polymerase-3 subunit alpha